MGSNKSQPSTALAPACALGSTGESAERAEKMHDCGARKMDDLNNTL